MRPFVNIKIMRSTLTVLAYLLLTVFGATATYEKPRGAD
jgi:hypothetical protein